MITDGWQGYAPLSAMGYRHRPKTQGRPERAQVILPRVHQVFGNLKTWLRGTHHGVESKHLQAYLDEFTFRFNRRRTPMAAFQSLPVPSWSYWRPWPYHPQAVVWCGAKRISLRWFYINLMLL